MADIAIIGAGTAGLTAAIYACRAGMDTVVIEAESYGGQIINTPEIENYPGIKNISGFDFATGLYEQASSLGARFEFDRINKIEGDAVGGFVLTGEYGTLIEAKALIVATGAKNRHMGLPLEEQLAGRGISYCATCDGSFFKGKDVAVFGGGNTALEDAEYLAGLCNKVYIIHRRDEFRGEKANVDRLMGHANVEACLSYVVKELKSEDGRLSSVLLESRKGEAEREISVSALFVAIGQIPSNDLVKGIVELDEAGYVKAGEDCKTSVEGIFTAGDGRTKKVRQLTTAAADGAVAATAACEFIRSRAGN